MRVLMISDLFPPHYVGGYETVCHEVAQGLVRRGHEVLVVTGNYGRAVGRRAVGGEGAAVRRTLTYRVADRPQAFWPCLVAEVRDNHELRRVLRDYRPDVAHVWNMSGLGKSLLGTLARARVPMAFSIHDRWLEHVLPADPWFARWAGAGRAGRLVDRLAPVSWDRSALRVAAFVSGYNLRLFTAAGFAAEVAEVIPNGVPIPRTQPAGRVAARRKLLYAGQLHPQKGVHHAVRALSTLAQQGLTEFQLTIVGTNARSASYPRHLAALAVSLGVSARVTFTGHLSRARVFDVMRTSDMLLFTSDDELGCPLVIAEAFAVGLPVVGSTAGGAAEIMEDGRTCLTFDPGDVPALAACVRRLASDEELAYAISVRARRFAERKLSLAAMVAAYEAQLVRAVSTEP